MSPEKRKLIAAMADLPQDIPDAGHLWADGLCMRTMSHRAGTVIIGAEYKKSHIFFIACGSVMIDVAGESTIITAGDVFVAQAGSQKAAYVLEDCTVACFYGTQTKNPKDLIEEFTTMKYDDVAGQPGNRAYVQQIKAEVAVEALQ
jgi:hypothetical protein